LALLRRKRGGREARTVEFDSQCPTGASPVVTRSRGKSGGVAGFVRMQTCKYRKHEDTSLTSGLTQEA